MKCDFLQRTKRTCCSLLLIVSLPAALLAGDARNVAVAVPLAAKQTEVAARNDDNPFPFVRPATMADAEYSPVRPGLSAALPPRRTGMSSSKKAAIILAIGGAAAMAGILAIKGGSPGHRHNRRHRRRLHRDRRPSLISARVLVMLQAASLIAGAQSLSGLVSGIVVDSRAASLRPVLGSPGAARLGDGLAPSLSISDAVSAGGRVLALSTATDSSPALVYLVRYVAGTPESLPLKLSIEQPDRMFLNAAGKIGFVYSSATGNGQFVSALDGKPVYSAVLSGLTMGKLTAALVEDSRACALVGSTSDESTGYVQRFCGEQPAQADMLVQQAGLKASGFAWLNQGRDAVIIDAGTNSVLLLQGVAQNATVSTLAVNADGVNVPVGVQVLKKTIIVVANSGDPSLLVLDATGAIGPRIVGLPDLPDRLELLNGVDILACNRVGPSPLMLVDGQQDLAAFLVPMN